MLKGCLIALTHFQLIKHALFILQSTTELQILIKQAEVYLIWFKLLFLDKIYVIIQRKRNLESVSRGNLSKKNELFRNIFKVKVSPEDAI